MIVFVLVPASWGLDQIIEKKTFSLKEFTLVSGKKIAPVQIGYETYGTLARTGDNVILICHFYSGNSHAAGKYSAEEKILGYWDAIIGPGKPFDTNKYFIVSSDTLCNMNPKNPKVITTGPASINPETGKAYGMSFPMVTIRDFINLQYELLKSLGVKKLKAVSGGSMGGIQSYEWAVAYPDFVERIIPVISTPKLHGWLIGWLKLWGDPIKLDPKWNNGNYYGKEEPIDGITYSLMLITLSANWADWAERSFGRKWADSQKNPYQAMENQFLIEDLLFKAGLGRANTADANSMLYLNKANALFDIGHGFASFEDGIKNIKAKVLAIGADTDILFPPHQIRESIDLFKKMGKEASYFEIKSVHGHLGGILDITQASEAITNFLRD
jgi:homoserine O-acetyltransferase